MSVAASRSIPAATWSATIPRKASCQVAKLAGQVYLRFKALPQAHPSDLGELAFHVHAIGRILFARAAIRAHPEHWTFK